MCFIVFHGIYYANGFSYQSKLVSEATKSYTQELVSKIKNIDGYNKDVFIYFHGAINENNLFDYYVYNDNKTFPLAMERNSLLMPWEYEETINRYAAFKYNKANESQIEDIKNSTLFKEMSFYPNSNSIKKIGNIIVVKFSE